MITFVMLVIQKQVLKVDAPAPFLGLRMSRSRIAHFTLTVKSCDYTPHSWFHWC